MHGMYDINCKKQTKLKQLKMKAEVFLTARYRAILRVLDNHPELFENKPQAIQFKEQLAAGVDELFSILAAQSVPLRSLMQNRVIARKKLREEFVNVCTISKAVASSQKNNELELTLKRYIADARSKSTEHVLVMLEQLKSLIEPMADQASELGLSGDRIDSLSQLGDEYRLHSQGVHNRIGNRLSNKQRVRELSSELNKLIVNFLDNFVRFHEKEHPAFGFEYRRVRFARRRRPSTLSLPENADISGMVLDATTEKPIRGAKVLIVEHNEVETTDDDGYFLFSDLQPGDFTLSCHALGYLVPEPVNIKLDKNDSVIHNFKLTLAQTPNN